MKQASKFPPICFYPVTTVFLDDDHEYLNMMKRFLDVTGDTPYRLFSKGSEAVKYINDHHQQQFWLRECISSTEDDDYNNPNIYGLLLHVDRLVNQLKNPNRFNEICALVTDYKMPEGTGLEFIDLLNRTPIFKIMLTGVMPPTDAIPSFNKQQFDVYLNKDNPQITAELVSHINNAMKSHFNEFTEQVIKSSSKLNNVLSDLKFIAFFEKFVDDHKIVEGYLLDEFGSYLLINSAGNGKILAVLHEEEFRAYDELLKSADGIDDYPELLTQITSRKKMPFFYNQNIDYIELQHWNQFLHDAKNIAGSDIYYCVIDDLDSYGVRLDDVVSYDKHWEKITAQR